MNSNFSVIKKWLLRLPAIFILCTSWYLSSQSRLPMPDFDYSDKLVHFICFGGLAGAWTMWFRPIEWKKKPLKLMLTVVAIVSTYGIIDELHQSFVPGRSCSAFDWVADTLGASLGCAIRILLNKFAGFLDW